MHLIVSPLEAKDVVALEGASAPLEAYVEVCVVGDDGKVASSVKSKTATRRGSLVSWHKENVTIAVDEKKVSSVRVNVKNAERGSSANAVGTTTLRLKDIKVGAAAQEIWLDLEKGKLKVSVVLMKEVPKSDGKGKHFTGNRPWVGAIFAPSDYKESTSRGPPSGTLELNHVYGYRARNCRSNIALIPTSGAPILAYHAAALGILQPTVKSSSSVFGLSKTLTAAPADQHFFTGHGSAEITDLAVDPSGTYIATSDLVSQHNADESKPAGVKVMVWEAKDPSKTVATLDCGKAMQGIAALAFSAAEQLGGAGKWIAAVGTDNDHTIAVFDWKTSSKAICTISGHSDKILDLVYHPTDPLQFATVGVKHIKFWTLDPSAKKLTEQKGLFGKLGEIQPLLCAVYANDGHQLYTGALNGDIYTFDVLKREVVSVIKKAHEGGVFAIDLGAKGEVISAGRDGSVVVHDKGQPRTILQASDCGSIRALAVHGHALAAGAEDSTIWYFDDYTASNCKPITIVEGHSAAKDGEVWGLAAHPSKEECVTAGEDGDLYRWDVVAHKAILGVSLGEPLGNCHYSPKGDQIAVSAIAKNVYIVNTADLKVVKKLEGASKTETLKELKFSPNGAYLAVGGLTSELVIDVYSTKDWSLVGSCKGHSSKVTHMDWSLDAKYIRSNSLDHELLFWDIPACTQQAFPSELKDVKWVSTSCTTAWPTTGIWQQGQDGSDINATASDPKSNWILSGDDFAMVNLYAYPADGDTAPCKSFRGHSAHVTNVAFTASGQNALSVGGLDGTLMQWSVKA